MDTLKTRLMLSDLLLRIEKHASESAELWNMAYELQCHIEMHDIAQRICRDQMQGRPQ